METAVGVEEYRSPRRKLLRFFVGSRDSWKLKCKNAKLRIKRLTNRVVSLERSRDGWKRKARMERERAARLAEELEQQKQSTA